MTALLNLFADRLNSAVFVLLVILGVVFYLTYKVGQMIASWQHKESDMTRLREDWNRDIPYIKERVNLMYSKAFNGVLQSNSPLTLTDVGKEIADKIGATQIVDLHIDKFRQQVDKEAPKNAYELQQACLNSVDIIQTLNTGELESAQQQAFESGLLLDNVLSVVAIHLRDKLMLEKGWGQTEIDKHNLNDDQESGIRNPDSVKGRSLGQRSSNENQPLWFWNKVIPSMKPCRLWERRY